MEIDVVHHRGEAGVQRQPPRMVRPASSRLGSLAPLRDSTGMGCVSSCCCGHCGAPPNTVTSSEHLSMLQILPSRVPPRDVRVAVVVAVVEAVVEAEVETRVHRTANQPDPRVIRVWFQNKRCKDKKKTILMKQQMQQEKVSSILPYIKLTLARRRHNASNFNSLSPLSLDTAGSFRATRSSFIVAILLCHVIVPSIPTIFLEPSCFKLHRTQKLSIDSKENTYRSISTASFTASCVGAFSSLFYKVPRNLERIITLIFEIPRM
ncbi:hypothetical protein B566_EDAN007254 [Ephemera danica]|nr:hypothetical protein B566_EDAN007254 [Ephemera danica]